MPLPFAQRVLRAGLASLVLAPLLVACGGSSGTVVEDDASVPLPAVDEARRLLNESMTAFNTACIVPNLLKGGQDFPVTVIAPNRRERFTRYRQLNALHEAGILRPDTSTSRQLERLTFRLTEKGQATRARIVVGRGEQAALCFAQPRVVSLDTIKALDGRTNRPLAEVVFQYEYSPIDGWAKHPEVEREFSAVRRFERQTANGVQSTRQTLVQTDDGWVDVRLRGVRRSTGDS